MFIIPLVFPVTIAICTRIICQHLPLISAPNLRREYSTAFARQPVLATACACQFYCELATALQYDRQNKQDKGKGKFFPPAALYVLCPMKLLMNGYIGEWLYSVYRLYIFMKSNSSRVIFFCQLIAMFVFPWTFFDSIYVCIYYIYSWSAACSWDMCLLTLTIYVYVFIIYIHEPKKLLCWLQLPRYLYVCLSVSWTPLFLYMSLSHNVCMYNICYIFINSFSTRADLVWFLLVCLFVYLSLSLCLSSLQSSLCLLLLLSPFSVSLFPALYNIYSWAIVGAVSICLLLSVCLF